MTTAVEQVRTLEECEANIERCLKSFWEMGEEYRHIRDNDLYKETHPTWATYTKERWGLERGIIDKVILATDIRARIGSGNGYPGTQLPTTEKQTCPLSILPPEEQALAWKEAVEEAGAKGREQPTHEDVKRAVNRRREPVLKVEPRPTDPAHDAAKDMCDNAEAFLSGVIALMPHVPLLSETEAEGSAYTIVSTCNAVLGVLEENGYVTDDVVRGVLGVTNSEEDILDVPCEVVDEETTGARESWIESIPSRVYQRRRPMSTVKDIIRSCVDLQDVSDGDLSSLSVNPMMIAHLRRAHDLIGRIISTHSRTA